jgi:hypothetical protein
MLLDNILVMLESASSSFHSVFLCYLQFYLGTLLVVLRNCLTCVDSLPPGTLLSTMIYCLNCKQNCLNRLEKCLNPVVCFWLYPCWWFCLKNQQICLDLQKNCLKSSVNCLDLHRKMPELIKLHTHCLKPI